MILVIDDDLAVRTSLQLLLKNKGYEVTGVETPAEAMRMVQYKRPELIILDLNFSISTTGEEGMGLLKEIKKADETIPVILITGWGSIALAVQGMKMGANDFINKPWDNGHLLQSVKTLLDLQEKNVV